MSPDRIYTEVAGATCYINGERGTVVLLDRKASIPFPVGAFVRLAERPAMLYAFLGDTVGERNAWSEVAHSGEITRDEFDKLTGLAQARRDMGWDL